MISITMKTILILLAVVAIAVAKPYDSKYDNFNAKEVVDNTRLLKGYGKCFLDQGPCTPEGADFKKRIPEALRDTCGQCSPVQRQLVRQVVKGFQAKLPEVWEELSKKEDPEGKYKAAFEAFLNASD